MRGERVSEQSLSTILDTCEADLRRIGLSPERSETEVRSECGALRISLTWARREAWSLQVHASAYGWNVWGKEQPIDEALAMAHKNVEVMTVAKLWTGLHLGREWTEAEMLDPVKVEAQRAARLREEELDRARAQADTPRRQAVLTKVANAEPLTPANKSMARRMELVIERVEGSHQLTELGRTVFAELSEAAA